MKIIDKYMTVESDGRGNFYVYKTPKEPDHYVSHDDTLLLDANETESLYNHLWNIYDA